MVYTADKFAALQDAHLQRLMLVSDHHSRKPLEQKIITALRKVLGDGKHGLHEPIFLGNERLYVQECIASTMVSSVGSYVDRFEEELAAYTGAKHAVAVVNGTAALLVALRLAGVEPKHEVLIPTLTFVATANAVHYLSAIPHFVDSSVSTLGLDPIRLREWLEYISELSGEGCRNRITGRRISALVPMHTFGHPCELEGLLAVARDFRLALVEDAAESLGSYYYGQHTGTFGLLGTISFNGNKIITTGGGGAILTNDTTLAQRAKHLTTTAKVPHKWAYEHDLIGYNFRMPNINAALGCAQLEQLENFLLSKSRLTSNYKSAFATVEEVNLMTEPEHSKSNYWLQTLILDESVVEQREKVIEAINNDGMMARPAWALMHHLRPNIGCPQAPLPIAELLAKKIINIPSSSGLA